MPLLQEGQYSRPFFRVHARESNPEIDAGILDNIVRSSIPDFQDEGGASRSVFKMMSRALRWKSRAHTTKGNSRKLHKLWQRRASPTTLVVPTAPVSFLPKMTAYESSNRRFSKRRIDSLRLRLVRTARGMSLKLSDIITGAAITIIWPCRPFCSFCRWPTRLRRAVSEGQQSTAKSRLRSLRLPGRFIAKPDYFNRGRRGLDWRPVRASISAGPLWAPGWNWSTATLKMLHQQNVAYVAVKMGH